SKNTSFRVHNDASQSERRAVLKNDRAAGTYFAFAAAEADAIRGRFAAQSKARVVGSEPAVNYPALPADSPWCHDPVPDEMPIDVDVSAAPIVGEFHEVAASLGKANSDDGRLLPKIVDSALPGDERSAARLRRQRRRRPQAAKRKEQ